MADERDKVMDDSSIKPVSSLRSKFETLGHGAKSPIPLRSPALQGQDARTPGPGRMSLDIPHQSTHSHGSNSNALGISTSSPVASPVTTPISDARRTHGPSPRSLSVNHIPTRNLTPPQVTVDAPRTMAAPPKPAPRSRSPSRSPLPPPGFPSSQGYGVSPKNSSFTTPALPPRSGAMEPPESLTAPVLSPRPQPSPRVGPGSLPPPVNRAGKPSISGSSISPPSGPLTPSAEYLALDLKPAKEISPFSTPPSSSEGTPISSTAPVAVESRRSRSLAKTPDLPAQITAMSLPDRAIPNLPSRPRIPSRSPSAPLDVVTNGSLATSVDGAGDRRTNLGLVIPKNTGSGRSSPNRTQRIPARPSVDEGGGILVYQPERGSRSASVASTTQMLAPDSAASRTAPPLIPAPRRSMETRRSLDVRPSLEIRRPTEPLQSPISLANDVGDIPSTGNDDGPSDYPDPSHVNRRPPKYPQRPWEFGLGYDTRLMTVCGEYLCSGGFLTRLWNIKTGESLTSIKHAEGVKVTAMAWKPMKDVTEEGNRLWLGTNMGDIWELDIPSRQIVHQKPGAHARGEVVNIFRHGSDLWSLDNDGTLKHWRPSSRDGVASLDAPTVSYHIPRGQSVSIVIGNSLWLASGKAIRVFNLLAKSEQDFNTLQRPLSQEGAGDITCAAKLSSQPNVVYFAHSDGKISVYDQRDYSLVGLFSVSVYKIYTMTGVGNLLWAGYSTGMIHVYDTSTTPWTVRKTWRAHADPVCEIVADPSSIWKLDRYQVVSLGMDQIIRIWDGMLEHDWIEDRMQQRDEEYCSFDEVTAAVMTWNAGASRPSALRNDQRDSAFFREYLTADEPPDILIFGFQELVDLEDKKMTAKSFFKSRKKDVTDTDSMSHQYRAWKDHLVRCLDEFMPPRCPYTLLQTADMVGLFTAIFVKSSLRPRIRQVAGADVKRGLGGLHGNKGAVILRMVLDDSSICLVNCHLAAGQSHTMHRNNDIAAIMESENLAVATSGLQETFVGGGDGTMILDHEICILNGDLNYRIDAMTRDAVVRAVRENNLKKLLDRDQLNLSKKRNPAFRLKLFQEMPIDFAPTYKYNVGTDQYDTSEKKRSPAWCDRVLFRGLGRIKCTEYRRWEVHASDHRPVTARFKMRVKSIDPDRRERVWRKTSAEYDQFRRQVKDKVKLDYLVNVLGLTQKQAAKLLQR